MTWLTPWFLLAGFAIAGPVLFHLWQRTPRGRRLFSSTMFLDPSPPRFTQRSRIEQWPLLVLRALALILLAIAFARPVWGTEALSPTISSPDKTVAILVDVSASLQRTTAWDTLIQNLTTRISQLPPSTHLGLFTFDQNWSAVVSFEAADRLEHAARLQWIQDQLKSLKPGWGATHLGNGLSHTIQTVRDFNTRRPMREAIEIWLATDLAAGMDLTGLAGIDWPESTKLVLVTPPFRLETNAGIQWVESRSETKSAELRVRITNAKHSTQDRFQLGWDDSTLTTERSEVHVPNGQSRTMLIPARPETLAEDIPLRLWGDDHDFDNRLWTANPRRRAVEILYLGTDSPEDSRQPRFYLEQALVGTPDAELKIQTATESNPPPAFTIWTDTQVEPPEWLQTHLQHGGSLLAVPGNADETKLMLSYLGHASTLVEEANVKDFSLLTEIDFEDPLFATFAQARFADFTGIHFWKHRRISLEPSSTMRTLARFENGDPFLIQQTIGSGRAWVMTSGWQPMDSQLARSSKFAPLLQRFLEQSTRITNHSTQKLVGGTWEGSTLTGAGAISIERPDRTIITIEESAGAFRDTTLPGIYHATRNGDSETWAVNIAPEESKTDLLPLETLERFGLPIHRPTTESTPVVAPTPQRQLQLAELEHQQSIWRWCLLAAGACLLLETGLAGWLSRRATHISSTR